jgi:hypothetical protein
MLFSNSVKHTRRRFVALIGATLTSSAVGGQGKAPPPEVPVAEPESNEASAAEALVLYLNLLDEVRESILQVEVKALSDLKDRVSYHLGGIIRQARESNAADSETQTRLVRRIREAEPTQRQFDDEREERLGALRNLDSNIAAVKKQIVDAAALLRGFITYDRYDPKPKSAHSVDRSMAARAASAKITSAIGTLSAMTSLEAIPIASRQADTLIMILRAVDDSLNKPQFEPTNKVRSDHAHYSQLISITQAKERAKQIIRNHFPPGLGLQVWIGFRGVWHVLEGVGDEDIRRRLLTDCLKVIPSWGGDRDGAAAELAKLRYL